MEAKNSNKNVSTWTEIKDRVYGEKALKDEIILTEKLSL